MSGSRAKHDRRPTGADYQSVDRTMIRDDVDWLHSMAQSVSGTEWDGPMGIALAPQMARVVHESFDYVLRRRPAVGRSLERSLSAEIEAARHTIKLVDDDERSIDDVLAAFEEIAGLHANRFAVGSDLAVSLWQGSPIYTSRSAEYQTLVAIRASDPYKTSVVMGQSMARILQSGLGVAVPPWKQVQSPTGAPEQIDEVAATYYPAIYSSPLTMAEKDLLLTVESSLNAASLYRAFAGDLFAGPVFRAQLIAFVHAVSALKTLVARHRDESGAFPSTMFSVIADDDLTWLVNQRALRNRAMHYGVPPALSGVIESTPMYGLVEATTNRSLSEVEEMLVAASARLTAELGAWRSRS